MNGQPPIDSKVLLEQVSWVRALARRLVDDRHEAEDVAQDALVVALGSSNVLRSGQEPLALRRWLGGVVRNLTRNARRRRGRERVETAPEPTPFPSALELVERAGMQRALVGAVLELPEADREVVLLRYVQGLSNEDVARALDIPPSTAASRLARALAKLEAKWRARHGEDGKAMLAVLAGLAPEPGGGEPAELVRGELSRGMRRPAPRWALGTIGVAAATIATGAVAVVGSAWLASDENRSGATSAAGASRPAPSEAGLVTASSPASALVAFLRQERVPLPAEPRHAAATCPSPLAVPVPIHGRVLDLEGRPVAGLEVRRIAPLVSLPGEWAPRGISTDPVATSDEEGRFELVVPPLGWVEPVTPGWAAVLASELGLARDGAESPLIVTHAAPLEGEVRDPDGRPLAGVSLLLTPVSPHVELPGRPAPTLMLVPARSESEANGAFRFSRGATGPARLALVKEGFVSRTELLELPLEEGGLLTLVLEPSRVPQVRGVVLDTGGRPVAGAEVSLGQEIVTTTKTGSFLVSFDPEHDHGHEGALLRAAHPRFGSARRAVELPGPDEGPREVEVVLDSPSHELAGRVLDPRGAPVPGLEVLVLEETRFGWIGSPGGGLWHRSLEESLGASRRHTDADGRFRLTGLVAREYRLQVLDPSRLVSVVTEPLAPDTPEVTVRFDPGAIAPVAGRVVDGNGQPLEGVSVAVSLRRGWSGPEDRGFDLAIGASAVSDREGRFRLEDVARGGVFLRMEGASIVPELFREIDDEPDRAALELVVGRRAGLLVEWDEASSRADRLHLEDVRGHRLPFAELDGPGVTPLEWIPVEHGSSPLFTIPAHAAFAVLTRDGQETERVPIQPVAGETVTLKP